MSNRQSPRWDSNRNRTDYNRNADGRPTGWQTDNRSPRSQGPNLVPRSHNMGHTENCSYSNWNDNPKDTGWRPNQQSSRYRHEDDIRSRPSADSNGHVSDVSNNAVPCQPNNGWSTAPANRGQSWQSNSSMSNNSQWGSAGSSQIQRSPSNINRGYSPVSDPSQHNQSGWNSSNVSPPDTSNWGSRTQQQTHQPSALNTTPPKSSSNSARCLSQQPSTSGWSSPAPTASSCGSSSFPQPSSNWDTPQPSTIAGWGSSAEPATPCSGWDSGPSVQPSGSGWDAPIIRTASSVDDVPAKKVVTREAEIEELFGSSLHPVSSSGINFDKYDSIPVDLKGDRLIDPIQSFEHLPLNEQLLKNIERARYCRPTPIQKYSIPIILGRRDLMACAQTGSGKTAAFLIPAINEILSGRLSELNDTDTGRRTAYPRVVILSPTRELALQIHFEARKFCFDTQCSCVVVYGGQDLRIQARDLSYGCDIVVATPGRLTDFLDKNRISLKNVKLLIFDEADRMLDMGFEPQIRRIVEQSDMTPISAGRQTVMFSATFPKSIQRLASQFLHDYFHLTVGRVGSTTDSIRQMLEYSQEHTKREVLLQWIPKIDGLTVVFVATKRTADMIADWFRRQQIPAVCIHGDRTQEQREDALQDFRAGKVKFLVATDVAARGLDIANVLWVINYDLPNTIDDYIHRIGRTGRCGNTGTALSFVNENGGMLIRHLYELLNENGQNVPGFLQKMIDDGVPEREQYRRRDGRPSRDRGARFAAPSGPIFRGRDSKTFEIG